MAKIYRKYNVSKADGTPLDPGAQYFVLRPFTDRHARAAMRAYSDAVRPTDPEMADDIDRWLASIDEHFSSCAKEQVTE